MKVPEKMFNMNEKGCHLQLHKEPTVLTKKGAKRVHLVTTMLLLKGKRQNPAWDKNLPTGTST